MEELGKRVDHIQYEEIKEIKEDISGLKVSLAENNILTKQCIESNKTLNETMGSIKDTMLLMSENMKQSNKNSEELAQSIGSLNGKITDMDSRFSNKFQEVDNKINGVDEKSKVDILTWMKNNWFGMVMTLGALGYIISQIVK